MDVSVGLADTAISIAKVMSGIGFSNDFPILFELGGHTQYQLAGWAQLALAFLAAAELLRTDGNADGWLRAIGRVGMQNGIT